MKSLFFVISFVFIISNFALASTCERLDTQKVMAQLSQTNSISEAMEVRESYFERLCSLENLEIVSRTEIHSEYEDVFPAYKRAIASYIFRGLQNREFTLIKSHEVKFAIPLVQRAAAGKLYEVVQLVASATSTCADLTAVLDWAPTDSNSQFYFRQLFEANCLRVGCKVVR